MSRSQSGASETVTLADLVARAAAASHAANLQDVDLHRAVSELASLMRVSVLEHGIVASDALRSAVHDIASRHLKRAVADRQLSRVLAKVTDRQLRNAIEIAHDHVLEPSEVAHYYAGLMAGLAFVELSRNGR